MSIQTKKGDPQNLKLCLNAWHVEFADDGRDRALDAEASELLQKVMHHV
jgi:hypothetical protein